MAILNATNDAQNTSRPPPKPAEKPALFVRTIIPKGAVSRTISCSMLPPHALSRSSTSRNSPPSLCSCRQLIVSTDTSIQVLAVQDDTLSLTPLTDLMLFTRIYDIAAVSSPVPGRDVLVVLADNSNISFVQFDDRASRLRCSGEVTVLPASLFPNRTSIRRQARLLATHPRKRMVAVASLQSLISVFPVLFLPKHVNAGKIATVAVDGVILSIDFLEDEEGVPGDAILVALLQKGRDQVISLYTVGVPPDSGGGLSVTFVGSMITCASHPDDVAVARATSQLTGESVRPTPRAAAVTRLAGCPFLFAVFVPGKIIAGDARSVIVNAHSGEAVPMSVRIEDDIMLPKHASRSEAVVCLVEERATRVIDDSVMDDDGIAVQSRAPEHSSVAGPSDPSALLSSASNASAADFAYAQAQDGYVTPTQNPLPRPLGEPPAVAMSSRSSRRGGRDDIPPMPTLGRRTAASRSPYTGQGNRNIGEDYLSYLYVPAYITLDVGDANGIATTWVDARDHFRDENGDGSGLYFVMESGAMFALKWSDMVKDGATTFRIPGGERTRTSPKRNFSVEFIGDVGPAVSIAALDRRLLYIANDGADGSLRQLLLPAGSADRTRKRTPSTRNSRGSSWSEAGRYGLEVRQEFLNLSPISDFVVVPSLAERRNTLDGKISERPLNGSDTGSSAVHRNGQESSNAARMDSDVVLKRRSRYREDQSALDHAIYGGIREAEIIACTGIGRHGSVRLIRPGAPVSIFAASERAFPACNNMWPIRFSKNAPHDAGLVLTFAQATGMFLSVPELKEDESSSDNEDEPIVVARLVNGTEAVGMLSDRRTIHIARLEDGIIAQIHEGGVRLILLKQAGDFNFMNRVESGVLTEPIFHKTMDWDVPNEGFISMGTIGAGFVLICIITTGSANPTLHLLKCYPEDPERGLCIVSSVPLKHELSCVEIPQWTKVHSDTDASSPRLPPMALLGTYAPSIEVRLLGPTMEAVDIKALYPSNKHTSGEFRNTTDTHRARSKPVPPKHGSSGTRRFLSKSDNMTAVPESLCALEIDERRMVFVGLRDGSVTCFSFAEPDARDMYDTGSSGSSGHLQLDSQRKLGHRPVVIKTATASIGQVILGQAERPWMCTSIGGGKIRWIPLAFPETRAMCSYSVYGAEYCFATVAADDCMYICGLRRNSSVSVRSFHVGSTPRRVLAVSNPADCLIVATTRDSTQVSDPISRAEDMMNLRSNPSLTEHSELRVYNKRLRSLLGSVSLLPGELVHVIINWLGFVVVGTSWGIQETGPHKKCKRGRLLLYSLRTSGRGRGSASFGAADRVRFGLCSEVILPGAVLAATAHPTADILVASCNEEVIVFGVPKSRTALVEIARSSARTLVVSLSIREDVVAVVDRKDSVSFFQLYSGSGKLVRDRSDQRRRIVSDAVQVNRTLAVAVDRLGGLFSIGYEDGDAPPSMAFVCPDGSIMSPYLRSSRDTEAGGHESAMDTGQAESVEGPSDLGQEFDVMQQGSGSEHSEDNNVPSGLSGSAAADDSGDVSMDMSDADHVAVEGYDDNEGDGSGGGIDLENGDGDGGQDGGTDEANPAQSADDGMMVIAQDEGNVQNGDLNAEEAIMDERYSKVPRNLVCHHSFNMNDTALRVRIASFTRSEKLEELETWGQADSGARTIPRECFFERPTRAVLCGTLGGALVSAVAMSAEAYELLSAVEIEVAEHGEIAGPTLGSSHKKFRSAYGSSATCCVDGDLLNHFDELSFAARLEIAERAGCSGENGVMYIAGMIRELFDRVG